MSSAVPQKTVPQSEGEFDLLCALASADLDAEERIQRIATWDLSSVDWSEFLRLAEHHGVLPLAARHLIDHARGLPPEIQRVLRSGYEANLRRSLWFTAQLAHIMEHFQREQLPAIAYKGPVLAQSLYRDLGLQFFRPRLPDFSCGLCPSEAGPFRNRISSGSKLYSRCRTIVAADRLGAFVRWRGRRESS